MGFITETSLYGALNLVYVAMGIALLHVPQSQIFLCFIHCYTVNDLIKYSWKMKSGYQVDVMIVRWTRYPTIYSFTWILFYSIRLGTITNWNRIHICPRSEKFWLSSRRTIVENLDGPNFTKKLYKRFVKRCFELSK